MDSVKGEAGNSSDVEVMMTSSDQEEMMMDLRRGPWTVEEDFALINYIAHHGEGRWNSLARCAGLKRTGKSCRLRWLNYLRPDVRRGNITLEEQLLILELHSRWGNRWSKIAQHLPGRTDNEIKNYWRTRVQKHAKQLKCDVNSKQFKDTMRYLWMPRLVERIQAAAAASNAPIANNNNNNINMITASNNNIVSTSQMVPPLPNIMCNNNNNNFDGMVQSVNNATFTPDNSSTTASSDSFGRSQVSPISDLTDSYNYPHHVATTNNNQVLIPNNPDYYYYNNNPGNNNNQMGFTESLISPSGYFNQGLDFQGSMDQQMNHDHSWLNGGDVSDNLWNDEDIWFLQQQFNNNL